MTPTQKLLARHPELEDVKIHPLALLFPEMTGKAFEDLCADIQARKQLNNPIVRHNGTIIDGRNRHRACLAVGVFPTYVEFEKLNLRSTVEQYILSQNMHRRHLTDDQKAMIAMQWKEEVAAEADRQKTANLRRGTAQPSANPEGAKTPPAYERAKPPGKTRQRLARMADVSEHKIRQAEAIKKANKPEIETKVVAGKLSLREGVHALKSEAAQSEEAQPRPKGMWLSNEAALIFGRALFKVARAAQGEPIRISVSKSDQGEIVLTLEPRNGEMFETPLPH